METGPQESSSTFGSLTARELPLLKIFVFVMICSYLDGYTVKKKAGTLRFAAWRWKFVGESEFASFLT
jgi:hypothetical protein